MRFLYLLFVSALLFFSAQVKSQEFTFKEKKEFVSPNVHILEAKFSPFRNYFALTYGDNTLEIYDKNWNKIFSHQANAQSVAGHLAFSPDEKYLAYAKYKSNNDIAIIRLEDKKVIQVLNGHSHHISKLVYSHDGKYLASSGNDDILNIWKFNEDEFINLSSIDYGEQVTGVDFSYDDKYIAVVGNDRLIHLYEFKNEALNEIQTIKRGKSYIKDVSFHPLKYEFVTGDHYTARRWRLKKKEFEFVDSVALSVNSTINYSPTGDYITLGRYNTLRILSATGELKEQDAIYRHSDYVFGAHFSSDGKFMVSCSSDKSAIVWEINGVKPSQKSTLVNFLNSELTGAQKQVLTPENIISTLGALNKSLTKPRDEFETTIQFNERRDKLSSIVLADLQKKIEKKYRIRPGSESVQIPLQSISGYNADLQIYKIRFMETEAGVEIPIPDAKTFKPEWQKAVIVVEKKINKDGVSFNYSNFKLRHPKTGKTYTVTPFENPFRKEKPGSKDRREAKVSTEVKKTNTQQVDDDSYYGIARALIFATGVYDSYSDLANPILDANTIAEELKSNYLVQPEVVENPTLNELISKIREYAKLEYSENDHLLIFIAGHGIYDKIFKEGYVISKDSQYGDEAKTSYLSHSNLRTMVNNIPCNHILLVMDVCFGGTFDPLVASHRGSNDMYADVDTEDFVKRKVKYKTRLYLTSGGNEYVPDGRPGHHSPFARRLLEAMRNYGGTDGILTMNEIIQFIEKVDPQPRFGEFGSNEPGSDFLLISK